MANPGLLEGRSPAEVEAAIGEGAGWERGAMRRGRNAGDGWTLRERNAAGTGYTDRYVQWSPGSPRHFGGAPYWKVSSATLGRVGIQQ